VVFDTAPLGHTLRLLALPEQLTAWIAGLIGRRRRLGVMQRMWRNVAGAAAGSDREVADPVLTALEERRARFEQARATITDPRRSAFVFVVIPEWLPVAETDRAVQTLGRYGVPVGAVLVNRVVPDDADGGFAARRRRDQASMRAEIARRFARVPVGEIPLLDRDVRGPHELRALVTLLGRERPARGG
jgi:arsenite-transporting ATPase